MKKYTAYSSFILAALLVSACSLIMKPPLPDEAGYASSASAKKASIPSEKERSFESGRELGPYITQQHAQQRKQQVANIRYFLKVELDNKKSFFNGLMTLEFDYKPLLANDLTIDFEGGTVHALKVNGAPVAWKYNGHFISLPFQELTSGKLKVEIKYSHDYANNGDGLHRYIDPVSKNVYLYTNFEPYYSNRLAPLFDQPDLKARYNLTVVAPSHWHVLSATREKSRIEVGNTARWEFPESPLIPSYIFPLHAGPYEVWEDEYEDRHGKIPLRVFVRPELAQYIKVENWFRYTKQSFSFFNEYFDMPYPFKKYDQIVVPEFNWGAMENLAAVTFSESFIKRSEKTELEKIRLANVISHEMAHMWFGNIVTMSWWNGLWLNESFATYMANLQVATNSDFKNIWENFYAGTKLWAYWTDQQVTSHPIELPVPSSDHAFTNFDGITYGKGASVLKQLPYFIGEENFRQGVAAYIKRHAYANTELEDFTSALGKAAGMDLSKWQQQWLFEKGSNKLEAKFRCDNDILTSLRLYQKNTEQSNVLRSQKVQVGLFDFRKNNFNTLAVIPVSYSGSSTEVKLEGKYACPDLVYPNYEDWGFVRVTLDSRSLKSLKKNINLISDEGLRVMLWQNLWESVDDIELPVNQFVEFALENISAEKNANIVKHVSDRMIYALDHLTRNNSSGRFDPLIRRLDHDMWGYINSAEPGSDVQKIWFNHWTRAITQNDSLTKAKQLLLGKLNIDGLVLDQEMRWKLVKVLNAFAFEDYQPLTEREYKIDASKRGQRHRLGAIVARPELDGKVFWLRELGKKDSTRSLSDKRAIMQNMFPRNQWRKAESFADQIIESLPQLAESQDAQFLRRYAGSLVPTHCSKQSVERLNQAVKSYGKLHPVLNKELRIKAQDDQRCVSIGARMES